MSETPNVLLVHCHDLGRHLGCYGADVETPNVDALADSGHRFDNCFSTAPQCSPSRGSIMTGHHPQEHGLMGLAHWNWALDEELTTLPMALSASGYETRLFGFQHEVPEEEIPRLGYDETWIESERALDLADRVGSFLDERGPDADPFFASVGFVEPHRPFVMDDVPDGTYDRYDPAAVEVPSYLPDEPGVREDVANLNALITATVDDAVGRITDALSEAGVREETLFVFTTDHGLALPRAKGTCYDPGVETALIVSQPDRFDSGVAHDSLLSNVDLFNTLLDATDTQIPDGVAGRSFLPLLDGRPDDYRPRDAIYLGMTWHDRYNPVRAVRTEDFKYVRNFDIQPEVYLPIDIFGTPAGRAVREEFYVGTRSAEELYDLSADPDEQENLASDRPPHRDPDTAAGPEPEYAETLTTLRERLRTWMETVDDPLLDGPVPHPTYEPV